MCVCWHQAWCRQRRGWLYCWRLAQRCKELDGRCETTRGSSTRAAEGGARNRACVFVCIVYVVLVGVQLGGHDESASRRLADDYDANGDSVHVKKPFYLPSN